MIFNSFDSFDKLAIKHNRPCYEILLGTNNNIFSLININLQIRTVTNNYFQCKIILIILIDYFLKMIIIFYLHTHTVMLCKIQMMKKIRDMSGEVRKQTKIKTKLT